MVQRFLLATALTISVCVSMHAQTVMGLTPDNKLVGFDATSPSQIVRGPFDIIGIPPDYEIVGMDVRPGTGELFVLTYHVQTMMARLYIVDPLLGTTTPVGANDIELNLGDGITAMDFNPVVDRIRVVSLTGRNYRLNPNNGLIAATDSDVAYAVGDPNQGTLPMIGGAAYTNSYQASEATALFVFDQGLSVLALQNPPNAGVLNTVGPTTVTFEQSQGRADMDIYFDPVSRLNMAFLATRDTSMAGDALYLVDLSTGATTLLGQMPSDIEDIAILIEKPPVEPLTGQLLYLLTKTSNRLLTIDSDNPTVIRSLKTISGVASGYTIVGLDVRPADFKLYALAYNRSSLAHRLYTIDSATGAVTAIGDSGTGMDLGAGDVAFDFNPVVDRIRVIGAATRNNYRLHPLTGEVVATDASVAYSPTDPNASVIPQVGSAAYLNNYMGAELTTLFAVDDSVGSIVTINPPNTGVMFTIAGNLFEPNPADKSTDMDFYYDSTDGNIGFMNVNAGASMNDDLYRIGETGDAQRVGPIGFGTQIIDLAAQLTYVGDTTTSSVAADKGQPSLTVSPNPALEGATINFTPSVADERLSVTDLTGRIVYEVTIAAGIQRVYVPLREVPHGLYFVHVHGATSTILKLQ